MKHSLFDVFVALKDQFINSEPLAKVTWTNPEATNGARIRPGDEEDAYGNPRFLAGNCIAKVCCGKEISKRLAGFCYLNVDKREYSKFNFEDTGLKSSTKR